MQCVLHFCRGHSSWFKLHSRITHGPDVSRADLLICRVTTSLEELLSRPGNSLNRHQHNIHIVHEPITNDISATKIRRELALVSCQAPYPSASSAALNSTLCNPLAQQQLYQTRSPHLPWSITSFASAAAARMHQC